MSTEDVMLQASQLEDEVAQCWSEREENFPSARANAERIVLAVNACAGISNAALEQLGTGGVRELLAVLRQAVNDWRDEMADDDEPISGTDMVEWFCGWYPKAEALLDKLGEGDGE